MTYFSALLLGIIQGLTEFFPISSSAHLAFVKKWMGIEDLSPHFDLACHLGTLLALILYFRHDLLSLFLPKNVEKEEGGYFLKRNSALLVNGQGGASRFYAIDWGKVSLFFFALFPLLFAYFLLKPLRTMVGESSTPYFLFVTAFFLFVGEHWRPSLHKKNRVRDALIIGTMQAAALFPGISRSASTISSARVLGWSTEEAVRFSFLLAIPTILGGNILMGLSSFSSPIDISLSICLIGFLSAFFMGLLVIRPALALLKKGRFTPFAIYCLMMGVAGLIL